MSLGGEDRWLAPDKLGHFSSCMLITLVAYAVTRRSERWGRHRFAAGAAAGLVAGSAKEAGDGLQVWPAPSCRLVAAI
jgi:hypothetical protein